MPLPSFHDVVFPEEVSYGSSGGPGFNTTVIELASGAEQRNVNWSQARATYDVSYGIKTREQMEEILDFFWARRGKAFGFRFKDWMDFTLTRQQIAIGDGITRNFQLFKRYEPSTDYFFDRPLTKIVPDTLQVWVDGNLLTVNIQLDTGVFSDAFGTPPVGSVIEAACEFHVPVRFDTDQINISHDDWEQMSWPSIPLVELKKWA